MQKTKFISIPLEDLKHLIKECIESCIKDSLENQNPFSDCSQSNFLSVKAAAQFLNLKTPTIYSKVKS